ncbi:MAG: radical SAM/SPASM domain-containing protein [Candidatus Aenigmatarchaeota archaeon]
MNLTQSLSSAFGILENKFLNTKRPVALRWNLTYRCNLSCEYCNLSECADKDNELSTEKIKAVLKEMSNAGVKRISFSGGEPLLREDIGEIIDYTRKVGITPTMNSNAILVPEKISELKNLGLLKISLDGTKEVHNMTRGRYEDTIKGLEIAIENNIKTTLCTTFTKENYGELDDLVEIAEKYETVIAIQRATNLYENFSGAHRILPKKEEIKEKMDEIINLKKRKPSVIRNSIRHLNLIKNYPKHKKIRCTAGKLFCIVLPDGTVTPCDRIKVKQDLPSLKENSFDRAFSELERVNCNGCCFCGSMELNYLYHLKFDVLRDLINFMMLSKYGD